MREKVGLFGTCKLQKLKLIRQPSRCYTSRVNHLIGREHGYEDIERGAG